MWCLEVIQQMNEKAHQEYLAKKAARVNKIDHFVEALSLPEAKIAVDKLTARLFNEAMKWPCGDC